MEKKLIQIQDYKGWKMYRQERQEINGYNKPVTKYWYYAIKNDQYFTGAKNRIMQYIDNGLTPNEFDDLTKEILNIKDAITIKQRSK